MKPLTQEIIKTTFGIVIICIFVWLFAWLAGSLVSSLSALDKTVASTLITGIIAVVSFTFTFIRESSLKRQEAHRAKKIEVYTIFFDFISELVVSNRGKDGSSIDTQEAVAKLDNFNKGLAFYGSPKVLLAVNSWQSGSGENSDPLYQIRAIGMILLAMREDIGLSNRGLDALKIQQLYIKDDISKLR